MVWEKHLPIRMNLSVQDCMIIVRERLEMVMNMVWQHQETGKAEWDFNVSILEIMVRMRLQCRYLR